MSSRFYRTLDEEANDPRYDESSPFDMTPAAYDTPDESPFEAAPPPAVHDKQKEHGVDPFARDEDGRRLQELDEQIKSRPRSIGGMIAAFSPQGDKGLQNLMAQRHLAGQETHQNMALRSAMARQLQQAENARMNAETKLSVAEKNAAARTYGYDRGYQGRVYTADRGLERGEYGADRSVDRARVTANAPKVVGPGGSVYNPATGSSTPQTSFKPPAPSSKPPIDPLVSAKADQIKKDIANYNKALVDHETGAKPLPDPKIIEMKRDIAKIDLDQLYAKGGGGGPQVPLGGSMPTAPAKAKAPTATGPNGEKIEWNGSAWVPAS